jgi:O-antigen/teichoic acid export membrane protein
MSGYTLLVQRIGLYGLTQIFLSIKGIILIPILTKNLGAYGFGIWAQMLITVSILQPFVQLGLGSAVVRFLASRTRHEAAEGILSSMIVVLLAAIVITLPLLAAADTIAAIILGDASSAIWIRLFAPLIALDALLGIGMNAFRIFGHIKYQSLLLLCQGVLELLLIGGAIQQGYGLVGAGFALIVVRSVALCAVVYYIVAYGGIPRPDFSRLADYIRFGFPLIPTYIFEGIIQSSDRYVIGFFLGAAAVGIYSASYSIGWTLAMFINFIIYILYPEIFSLYDRGDIPQIGRYLSYSWKFLFLFLIPSVFGLSVLAGPLLEILTTAEFIAPGIYIIPLVAGSTVLYSMYKFYDGIIRLSKNTQALMYAIVIGGLINIVLNILLIPVYGVVAAAGTTFLSYFVITLLVYRQSRFLHFPIDLVFAAKSTLASGIMALALRFLNPHGVPGVATAVVIGAVLYFALILLFNGIKKEEMEVIGRSLGLTGIFG